jgi:hypothetical protein
VTLSTSLEVIGDKAFNGCTALSEITLPEDLETIGTGAFAFCKSLPALTVPGSVVSVGEMAYTDCIGLATITFENEDTEIKAHAFENADGTNLKDRFVLTGLAEDSKVVTYAKSLTDSPVTEEADTEAVDPA